MTQETEKTNEDVKDQEQQPEKVEKQYTDEEKTAISKGWKPKDEWEGDEADWKPAKAFNEIGILKEEISKHEREVKKLNKVNAIMAEHYRNVRQTAYDQAVKDLKAQREAALESEDFVKAERIKDKLDEVKDRYSQEGVLPKEVEKEIKSEVQSPDPEFYAFMDRNPWYKPGGKDEMSKKADALGWAYAQEDRSLTFKDVIQKVEKDIRKLYPEKFDTPKSPVNDNGNRGTTSASNKQTPKLSQEELDVARTFGMTPEEYVKAQASYKGR